MSGQVTSLLLLLSLLVREGEAAGVVGAASGGAAGAAGAAGTFEQSVGGAAFGRNAIMDILGLVIMGAFLVGAITVFIAHKGVKLFKKHVLKIPDPPKSFVMEKRVKCKSGHNMMLFHVPQNVCSYIQCGSKSACEKRTDIAGFAAWYSCPVCAYRICSGCASVDIPDFANKDKNSVENLLARQFVNFGSNKKKNISVESGDPQLPGQVN